MSRSSRSARPGYVKDRKLKRRAAKNKAAKLKLLLHNDIVLGNRIHGLRLTIIEEKHVSVRWFFVAKYWVSLKVKASWEEFKRVRYR